ncbi:MAG: terminase gpA endonuclease subunit [Pirellula sp.]
MVKADQAAKAATTTRYQQRKERERERQADQSRTGRDIGTIPPCGDVELRARVTESLRLFCELCFPRRFNLGWSEDHLEVIARMQACIDDGMLYTLAMPRGSGKTTLVQCACLWAILTGRRKYVALIGADRDAAIKLLVALKSELESNDKLLELFPEAVYPIRKLDGRGNRATGQLYLGKRTHIEWKGPRIVLPTIADIPILPPASSLQPPACSENGVSDRLTLCSGAIIECCGILGRVRGMVHTAANGAQVRPDLFILDDPQTDRSAVSTTQVARRLSIITGAVLGLAGPDVSIAGFATVTVIAENDVADQLLDREKFPDWQGKRYQMIYAWPERMDLWEQYAVLRAEGLRTDGNIAKATAFYSANQNEMDLGSAVAWPARKKPGEISGLQSAFNQKLRSPGTFDAEFQNQPKEQSVDVEMLSVDAIEAKLHNYTRGELPREANLITGFIDVQGELLYWIMIAWTQASFTGWVLDYGTWPEQVAKHFSLRGAQNKLSRKYPRAGLEGRLHRGLTDLVEQLAAHEYVSPGGVRMSPALIGVDQAWGPSTKTVKAVVDSHARRAQLLACQGKGFDVGDRHINEWTEKPGELRGDGWIVRPSAGGGRHCIADSNQFKSFVNARLNVATGDPGSLSLYRPQLATEHRLIAEHWRAEKPSTLSSDGRSIEKWKLPPSKPDNHWWDGLYWSAVLASIRGARLESNPLAMPRPKRKRRGTKLVA